MQERRRRKMRKITGVAIMGWVVIFMAVSSFAATSPQALQDLEKAAKAEGQFIWQVPGSTDNWQPVADRFQAKYPDIKVSVFAASSAAMPARIITEARVKRFTFDLASANPEWILPLIERDLLEKYDPGKMTEVRPNTIIMNGFFHNFGDSPLFWAYNTNLVSKNDVPRTWDDLLRPKFKGSKISLRRLAQHLSGLYPEWRQNPDKIIQYLKQLKAQDVMWAIRLQDANNRVANGESLIGVFRTDGFTRMKKEGAPIEIAPISPSLGSPSGGMLVKGVAHPNAARLFITWMHSPEGRRALDAVDSGLAAPCEASPFARALCDKGIKFILSCTTIDEVKTYMAFEIAAAEALGIKE
jgi:iron(III) transport system substrate-binding protein